MPQTIEQTGRFVWPEIAFKVSRALLLMLALNAATAMANGLDGRWIIAGEKPGEILSIVRLEPAGSGADALFRGFIEMLTVKPGEDPNPKCNKCSGANKDASIKGMEFMSGLKRAAPSAKGEITFEDGKVIDPESGKSYRCKMVLAADGQSVKVTYYLGFLSQSEVWTRTKPL